MKLNNKKRQNAVYSTKYLNVYTRFIRGQKVRKGALKSLYNPVILFPKALQEKIEKEMWKNISFIQTRNVDIILKKEKGKTNESKNTFQ